MWRYYFQGAIYQLWNGNTEDEKTCSGNAVLRPVLRQHGHLAVTIKASIVPTEAGQELFGGWFLDVYGQLVASQRSGRSSRARAGLGPQG